VNLIGIDPIEGTGFVLYVTRRATYW
jgi:hypothetical protein